MTGDGYPDQVYAALHPSRPGLKLVKLGCPGETTTSMINGGICRYQGGSQLAVAVAFLQAHRGRVLLVSLDIGANDPEYCGGEPGLGALAKCAVKDVPAAVTHLGTIMDRLKAAAGSGRADRRDDLLPARACRMAQRTAGAHGRPGRGEAGRHLQPPADPGLRQVGGPGREHIRRLQERRFHPASGRSVPRNVARLCR